MANPLMSNVVIKSKSGLGVVSEFVRTNPLVSGGVVALGGAAIVAGGVAAVKKKAKRKTATRKKKKTRKKTSCKRKTIRRTPRTAGKGKDRSTRRIRMTKNGQPYVIMRSGKARFISKRSAANSRRRKGGRY